MTIVIKEDKREEEFDENKLTRSIKSTMLEIGEIDNNLIDVVRDRVNEFIRDKEYVFTKDLRNEIIKILATEESSAIAKAYMMFTKEGNVPNERVVEESIGSRNDPSACGT